LFGRINASSAAAKVVGKAVAGVAKRMLVAAVDKRIVLLLVVFVLAVLLLVFL
jgi:hypothetical protein